MEIGKPKLDPESEMTVSKIMISFFEFPVSIF